MPSKSTAARQHRPVSNTNPQLAPSAASHVPTKPNRSAVLQSRFAPEPLHVSLFASVVQALDSHTLRVHDTVSRRLVCEYSLSGGSRAKSSSGQSNGTASGSGGGKITCLDWGTCGGGGDSELQNKKKKRRKIDDGEKSVEAGGNVVALGTTYGEVLMYSPAEAKVVGTLKDSQERGAGGGNSGGGIRDFRFKNLGRDGEAWSLGSDDRLVQWDVRTKQQIRSLELPTINLRTFLPLEGSSLVASHNIYLVNHSSPQDENLFPGAENPVLGLVAQCHSPGNPFLFASAKENERFVQIVDTRTTKVVGNLVAGSSVEALQGISASENQGREWDQEGDDSAVAVVTEAGEIEMFTAPFDSWHHKHSKSADVQSLKKARKERKRNANSTIRFVRPGNKGEIVPILGLSFEGSELLVALAEGGGLEVDFERVPWRNGESGKMILDSTVEIVKNKLNTIGAAVTNGVKNMGTHHVDESRAVVAVGGKMDFEPVNGTQASEVIDISSGVEESDESSDSDEEMQEAQKNQSLVNGTGAEVLVKSSQPEIEEDEPQDITEEASFGELMRAKHPDIIKVEPPQGDALMHKPEKNAEVTTILSLGNILTQALRTNDSALLESCFRTHDLHVVRATIERLDSSLATSLLLRLAERLHLRPGRAGSLMVWVQWTLVAHGGYLGAQRDVAQKLAALHRVIKQRANSLQPLLALKGKLDMLEAQMNLRRNMQQRYGTGGEELEDEEAVTYVEGQDESTSDEEDEEEVPKQILAKSGIGSRDKTVPATPSDSDEEMEDAMEGELDDMDDDDDDDEDEDEEESDSDGSSGEEEKGFIDDEASEAEDDSEDDDIDHDDIDLGSDEEEDEGSDEEEAEARRPVKVNGILPHE